jgi:CubicO group peptidase (beta-lactamase class C family)
VWRIEGSHGTESEGAVGVEDLGTSRTPARLDTVYDLASLTKPLATALLLLLLEQEQRIDLEAEARLVLPELTGSPYEDASFIDLGVHRSGLPAWRPLYLQASDVKGYLAGIVREPRATTPGSTLYSDLGFILLGAALERIGGESLDHLFATRIAAPLGLPRIGFANEGERFADAAPTEIGSAYERGLAGESGHGYAWKTDRPRGEVHDENARVLGGVAGHAGLFGTSREVAAIAREMLWPRILPLGPRQRKLLLSGVEGPGSRAFGLMPAGESETLRNVLPGSAVGHFGFTGTSLWLDPAAGRIYVLLTNRVHPRVPREEFTEIRREFHLLASV